MRLFSVLAAAAVALAVALVSCSIPTSPDGDGTLLYEGGIRIARPVVEQLAYIQQTAVSNTQRTVYAYSDERIHATQLIYYAGRNNIQITIRSVGEMRVLSLAGNHTMFDVQGDNTLILENIILQGHYRNNNPLLMVNQGAEVTMRYYSEIRGNSGHGVLVNGGNFTMGWNTLITGNSSKGIYANGGEILIDGFARVYRNSGGVSLTNATLEMGEVSEISFNNYSGGVFMTGTGAQLTMRVDSRISNNTSRGGVLGAGGVLAMGGSEINMIGGNISNNINMSTRGGGGVTLHNSKLYMLGETVSESVQIYSNRTNNLFGGGVWLEHSSNLNIFYGRIGGFPDNLPGFDISFYNTTSLTTSTNAFNAVYLAPGTPSAVNILSAGGVATRNTSINMYVDVAGGVVPGWW